MEVLSHKTARKQYCKPQKHFGKKIHFNISCRYTLCLIYTSVCWICVPWSTDIFPSVGLNTRDNNKTWTHTLVNYNYRSTSCKLLAKFFIAHSSFLYLLFLFDLKKIHSNESWTHNLVSYTPFLSTPSYLPWPTQKAFHCKTIFIPLLALKNSWTLTSLEPTSLRVRTDSNSTPWCSSWSSNHCTVIFIFPPVVLLIRLVVIS